MKYLDSLRRAVGNEKEYERFLDTTEKFLNLYTRHTPWGSYLSYHGEMAITGLAENAIILDKKRHPFMKITFGNPHNRLVKMAVDVNKKQVDICMNTAKYWVHNN